MQETSKTKREGGVGRINESVDRREGGGGLICLGWTGCYAADDDAGVDAETCSSHRLHAPSSANPSVCAAPDDVRT